MEFTEDKVYDKLLATILLGKDEYFFFLHLSFTGLWSSGVFFSVWGFWFSFLLWSFCGFLLGVLLFGCGLFDA